MSTATCAPLSIPPSFVSSQAGTFAFARVHDNICLVQSTSLSLLPFPFLPVPTLVSRPIVSDMTPACSASALTTVDVKIFRHEFITIFRLSQTTTLHPADIHVLEPIADDLKRYEEENETVFVAKDVVERMRKITDRARRMSGSAGYFVASPERRRRRRRFSTA